MTAGAVLNFEDPRFRSGLFVEAAAEQPIRWTRMVEHALRRRAEQLRRAVETVQLDENGPCLLSTAPSHRRERSLDVAAPDIGGNPDRRFQAHLNFSFLCSRRASIHHMPELDESRARHFLQ